MFNIFLLYRSLPAWRLCHHGSLLIQLEITHKLYVASRRLAEAAACTLRLRGPHQPLSPPLIHRLLLAAAEVEQTCPPPSASSELCAHQRFGVCACMRERERASERAARWKGMRADVSSNSCPIKMIHQSGRETDRTTRRLLLLTWYWLFFHRGHTNRGSGAIWVISSPRVLPASLNLSQFYNTSKKREENPALIWQQL